jgi:hypothetical protein
MHERPRTIARGEAVPRTPAGKLRVADARSLFQEVSRCQT